MSTQRRSSIRWRIRPILIFKPESPRHLKSKHRCVIFVLYNSCNLSAETQKIIKKTKFTELLKIWQPSDLKTSEENFQMKWVSTNRYHCSFFSISDSHTEETKRANCLKAPNHQHESANQPTARQSDNEIRAMHWLTDKRTNRTEDT